MKKKTATRVKRKTWLRTGGKPIAGTTSPLLSLVATINGVGIGGLFISNVPTVMARAKGWLSNIEYILSKTTELKSFKTLTIIIEKSRRSKTGDC